MSVYTLLMSLQRKLIQVFKLGVALSSCIEHYKVKHYCHYSIFFFNRVKGIAAPAPSTCTRTGYPSTHLPLPRSVILAYQSKMY